MKIDIWVSSFGAAKDTEATVAVLVRRGADHHFNIIDLNQLTKNEAELIGIQYALVALATPMNELELKISTNNPYAYGMFQMAEGEWHNKPKKNIEIIASIRDLLSKCSTFEVNLQRSNEFIDKMSNIQRKRRSVSELA